MDDFKKMSDDLRAKREEGKERVMNHFSNLFSSIKDQAKSDIQNSQQQQRHEKLHNFSGGYLECQLTFRGKHESMEKVYDAFYAMQKRQKRENGAGQLLPGEVPPNYFGHFYNLDVADYNEDEIPEMILYRCEANPNYDMINYFISSIPNIEFVLSYVAENLSRAGVCYSQRKNRYSNNVTDFVEVIDLDRDDIQQIMEQQISRYNKIEDPIQKYWVALDSYVGIGNITRKLF